MAFQLFIYLNFILQLEQRGNHENYYYLIFSIIFVF